MFKNVSELWVLRPSASESNFLPVYNSRKYRKMEKNMHKFVTSVSCLKLFMKSPTGLCHIFSTASLVFLSSSLTSFAALFSITGNSQHTEARYLAGAWVSIGSILHTSFAGSLFMLGPFSQSSFSSPPQLTCRQQKSHNTSS